MNKGNDVKPKNKIVVKVSDEFFRALQKMAADSGMGKRSPDRFASELLEVAVIETYEQRYGEPLGPPLPPQKKKTQIEPAAEESEDTQEENTDE